MRYFRALTLSLAAHFLITGILWFLAPKDVLKPRKITTVELLEAPQLQRRPHKDSVDEKSIVKQTEVPKNLLTEEKHDTKLASQFEQNVTHETRARVIDETKNRSNQTKQTQQLARKASRGRAKAHRGNLDFNPESALARAEQENLLDPDGSIEAGKATAKKSTQRETASEEKSVAKPLLLPGVTGEHGISTLGEGVPENIAFGDFTALNTDRALFYTFYARIDDAIRQRWITYVKASLYELVRRSQVGGRNSWKVELEILLDRDGKFVKAIVHESSGVRKIDAAPVQAFRDAFQFPNPPVEMVKKDGQIHLNYAFVVHGSPSVADSE